MKKLLRRLWNMLCGRAPDYDIAYTVEITNLDNYAHQPEDNMLCATKITCDLIDATTISSEQINATNISTIFRQAGYLTNDVLSMNDMRYIMGLDYAGDTPDVTVTDIYSSEGRVMSYVEKK